MTSETIRLAAERLSHALETDGFAGYDPYDALSSPVVSSLARTRALRVVAIQALKRAPVNVRPALHVPRKRHAKALALLVSAHARLARLPQGDPYRPLALALARELAGRAVPTAAGAGFAYDFDVDTRWGSYRAGQPNAVVTSFAAHALLDAAELGEPELAEPARAALRFACTELLVERSAERWFAYYPGSRTPIHNASLLVASVAARCAEPASEQWGAACDAVAFSLARQRPNGSWPYGEHPRLGWVDGFHTAYVLEAIARWHARTGDSAARKALASGLDLYLERLIDPDGAPRASLSSRYPLDIHAAASAVTALCRLAHDRRSLRAAASVLDWTLRTMRRDDGRFAFQRHRLWRNAVPYVRWSDGHMLLALASFLTVQEEIDEPGR